MGRLGDSTTRLAFPVDANLGPLVCAASLSFFRLVGLPRPASSFITRQLMGAIRRLPARSGARSVRVALTLSRHKGRIRAALRVSGAGAIDLRLASLTRGAPPGAEAKYRPGRGGGTLTFSSAAPRDA
jgi:hypothetical protein